MIACFTMYLSLQAWKDKYIEGYVALAGVFGGASKAIRSLVSGLNRG